MKYIYTILLVTLMGALPGCSKMIKIDPPSNVLTTSEVFETPGQAQSALAGIYYRMVNDASTFSAGRITLFAGLSADEFILFDPNNQLYSQFYNNELISSNGSVGTVFWRYTYRLIFEANSIIENVEKANFRDSIKAELVGQAYFLRAFCNFYLVNLFGDVPNIRTTNWQKTNLAERNTVDEMYTAIIEDLQQARLKLQKRFLATSGERIIPNYYAATALLARVYLYRKNWKEAELLSGEIIDATDLFSLVDVDKIYTPNNSEAILQLKQQNLQTNLFASPEGVLFIPRTKNSNLAPVVYLYPDFLNAIDLKDRRKTAWIDSTKLTTTKLVYYYPFKYKVGNGQTGSGYTEYHTVMRLSEQYLIRSEAMLNMMQLDAAIDNLNVIRQRAGLLKLDYTSDVKEIKTELMAERRIELFAEWGNRWFDLKRWGIAGEVLSGLKKNTWNDTDTLYPIPLSEIATNPNLTQNEGY